MFRYSKFIAQKPAGVFSPLSYVTSSSTTSPLPSFTLSEQKLHFHTATTLLDGKKDAYKRRLLISNLLKKKQKEKAKKQRKSKASSGKKSSRGVIKQVSPQMKTTGKDGSSGPKDVVYDGTPRVKMNWNKKNGFLPYEETTNAFYQNAKERNAFITFLQTKRNVDTKSIQFDSNGNVILAPLFNLEGLHDLSGYVTQAYKTIESDAKSLNETLNKPLDTSNVDSAKAILKDMDRLVQSIHELSATLTVLRTFATIEKNRSDLKKYIDELNEAIPQILSDNCDNFSQALKNFEKIFENSSLELKAVERLNYWLKRYGAFISKEGYNQYTTTFKSAQKHFTDLEKRAENIVFVSLPMAYEHQLPRNIRSQITKTRTKYLGLDSYKVGSSSFVLPVLKHVRDPFVRRDVFNQAREAIDGEKNKYLPSLQQSSQLVNKLASSLGFENVVSMQMTEKYNLAIENVRSTLLDLGRDAYNEEYIAGLVKSKKKENYVWKYTDKEKDTIPDYDKLHAEFVHFEEIMGAFPQKQTKSFLPLFLCIFSYIKQVENSFGVRIKGELARAGELADDETIKKFVIYDKETNKPISRLYLDIFPREGKQSDEAFSATSIPRVSRSEDDVPCVIVRGNTEERYVNPTLTHNQLSDLYRALGEACYDAIIAPKLPYHTLSNELEKKTLGSYFARLVHNKNYLSSIAAHFYNLRNAPVGYIEEMLVQDPIVKPFKFVSNTARALLDIDIFTSSNTKNVYAELEAAIGKGKFQPDLTLANSMESCGSEFVPLYADLLGAELFFKYPTTSVSGEINGELKSLLLNGTLNYTEEFNAIKEELKEASISDIKNEQHVATYGSTDKTPPPDTFYSTQEKL